MLLQAVAAINDEYEDNRLYHHQRCGDCKVIFLVAICAVFYFAMVCTQSSIAAAIFAAISIVAWLLVFAVRRELLGLRWKLLLFMYGRAQQVAVVDNVEDRRSMALMSNCDDLAIGTTGNTHLNTMQNQNQPRVGHQPTAQNNNKNNSNESKLRAVLSSNHLPVLSLSRSPH